MGRDRSDGPLARRRFRHDEAEHEIGIEDLPHDGDELEAG